MQTVMNVIRCGFFFSFLYEEFHIRNTRNDQLQRWWWYWWWLFRDLVEWKLPFDRVGDIACAATEFFEINKIEAFGNSWRLFKNPSKKLQLFPQKSPNQFHQHEIFLMNNKIIPIVFLLDSYRSSLYFLASDCFLDWSVLHWTIWRSSEPQKIIDSVIRKKIEAF